jgi:hypothetical protein
MYPSPPPVSRTAILRGLRWDPVIFFSASMSYVRLNSDMISTHRVMQCCP